MHMRAIVKSLLIFLLLLSVSWALAWIWSGLNDAWLRPQLERMAVFAHPAFKPILSDEVWRAEEQLEFYSLWVPTFALVALVTGVGMAVNRRGNGKKDCSNLRLHTDATRRR